MKTPQASCWWQWTQEKLKRQCQFPSNFSFPLGYETESDPNSLYWLNEKGNVAYRTWRETRDGGEYEERPQLEVYFSL